jgi:hypothetical protein
MEPNAFFIIDHNHFTRFTVISGLGAYFEENLNEDSSEFTLDLVATFCRAHSTIAHVP